MSPSASSPGGAAAPRFAVVGNPENRRVTFFREAVRAAGLERARVVSWLQVLRGEAEFQPGETVRIDSPGEDTEVERLLRGVDDPTRVEGSARWYAGFLSAVGEVTRAASAAGAEVLTSPGDIAALFDKRLCHALLEGAEVPVPASPTSGPQAAEVRGWSDVRALLREHRMPRAFVKLAHGSSPGLSALLGRAPWARATTADEVSPVMPTRTFRA
ncbi:STM4014 family protein, partial [Streptomyces cyaneofuscatus]